MHAYIHKMSACTVVCINITRQHDRLTVLTTVIGAVTFLRVNMPVGFWFTPVANVCYFLSMNALSSQ